jgi:hypothetical protein
MNHTRLPGPLLAAGSAAEPLVKRDEIRARHERSRKRERIGQPQRPVTRAQACGSTSKLAVNRDDGGADGIEELIHLRARSTRKRANHHLRIDARANHDLPCPEARPQKIDSALVLIVACVQERDHDVSVERYSRHSRRSSSR